MSEVPQENITLIEKVIHISRVSKVVKGGRRFHFNAVVVVGNRQGLVGLGLGKANEVSVAIRKGVDKAKKSLVSVPILNSTIPHEVIGTFGSGKVLLKPASRGKGIIAGGAVKAIIEAAGIANILTKCIGSHNPHNIVKATMHAFSNLRTPEDILMARKGGEENEPIGA